VLAASGSRDFAELGGKRTDKQKGRRKAGLS
jgi:hypothetical protein